jgi:hypothetical protein
LQREHGDWVIFAAPAPVPFMRVAKKVIGCNKNKSGELKIVNGSFKTGAPCVAGFGTNIFFWGGGMKTRSMLLLVGVAVLAVGCAAPRQSFVGLDKSSINGTSGKVGIVMTPLPKVDTRFPGADCLLCMATASLLNSSLTSHTQKLPPEGLPELKDTLAELIRKNGGEAVVISDPLKLDALPDFGGKGPNIARKDFSSLKQKYAVDKVLVLDVPLLGVYRNFSAYIPTSDPRAEIEIDGYLVNLSNNTYEWYQTFSEAKGATGNWDEPPNFPGLTNAYFQVLETGKDRLVATFK